MAAARPWWRAADLLPAQVGRKRLSEAVGPDHDTTTTGVSFFKTPDQFCRRSDAVRARRTLKRTS